MRKQFFRLRVLHNPAFFHHENPVAHLIDHVEVMRDKENRELKLLLKLDHQLHDLLLNRHIESGNRFVGKDQA